MKYHEEPNCNASYQRFCWDVVCWRVFSSFSVICCVLCAVVHLIYIRLTSTCAAGPSHHHEEIILLWCHCSETDWKHHKCWPGSSGCHPCCYVFVYSFALFFSSAVSGVMWSSCFHACVFVLCLSLDYDVLQHTLTHPQTAAFPIQIAECHSPLHLEPTACLLLWLSKASSLHYVLFGWLWSDDNAFGLIKGLFSNCELCNGNYSSQIWSFCIVTPYEFCDPEFVLRKLLWISL